jgi:hypothetical protein
MFIENLLCPKHCSNTIRRGNALKVLSENDYVFKSIMDIIIINFTFSVIPPMALSGRPSYCQHQWRRKCGKLPSRKFLSCQDTLGFYHMGVPGPKDYPGLNKFSFILLTLIFYSGKIRK